MNSAEVVRWVTVVATLLAVAVALFKEEIQRWWRKPELQAKVGRAGADCHKTHTTISDPSTGRVVTRFASYYLRVWVENTGNQRAEHVQVFTSRLQRVEGNGALVEVTRFLPMNLRWAHINQPFLVGLSPRMGAHCDVGHVDDPSNPYAAGRSLAAEPGTTTCLALCQEVEPATGSHLLGPGTYRLELKIAASNCEPVTKTLELFVSGDWYADEEEMFRSGLTMREVS